MAPPPWIAPHPLLCSSAGGASASNNLFQNLVDRKHMFESHQVQLALEKKAIATCSQVSVPQTALLSCSKILWILKNHYRVRFPHSFANLLSKIVITPQLAFFLSVQVSLGSPRKCTNVRTGLGPVPVCLRRLHAWKLNTVDSWWLQHTLQPLSCLRMTVELHLLFKSKCGRTLSTRKDPKTKTNSALHLQKAWRGASRGGFKGDFKPFSRGLQGGLKEASPLWSLQGLEGGFKGAWEALQGSFKGASRRLEKGFKGASKGLEKRLKGAWRWRLRSGLEGGLRRASRGLQKGFKGASRWRGPQGGLKGASEGL